MNDYLNQLETFEKQNEQSQNSNRGSENVIETYYNSESTVTSSSKSNQILVETIQDNISPSYCTPKKVEVRRYKLKK